MNGYLSLVSTSFSQFPVYAILDSDDMSLILKIANPNFTKDVIKEFIDIATSAMEMVDIQDIYERVFKKYFEILTVTFDV